MISHSLTITCFFFLNSTATTKIYTLSLHDALPILGDDHAVGAGLGDLDFGGHRVRLVLDRDDRAFAQPAHAAEQDLRSEEHTSELQSHSDLVCRLLLEKKKTKDIEYDEYMNNNTDK